MVRRVPLYFAASIPLLLVLLVALVVVVVAVELGAIGYAYERIGIPPRHVFALLLLSLLGSHVNVPLVKLPAGPRASEREVSTFGTHYVIPAGEERSATIVAVNLGGAVLPAVLSVILLVRNGVYLAGLLGAALVSVVVHGVARPVRGVGIAVPVFVPPAAAAAIALLIAPASAPAVAYVAGSLGTLVGADLLNLGKARELGAPVVSIGGAGTFDGIFLTGILAVLLA
jgi:uncharacterized membrane protein